MGRATPKAKARTKSATDTSRDEPKSPKPVSAKLRARDTTRNPTMAGMTRVKYRFFNLVCIDTPHRPVPQETGKRAATARFPPITCRSPLPLTRCHIRCRRRIVTHAEESHNALYENPNRHHQDADVDHGQQTVGIIQEVKLVQDQRPDSHDRHEYGRKPRYHPLCTTSSLEVERDDDKRECSQRLVDGTE